MDKRKRSLRRKMNCDWCGQFRECDNLKDTHYMVCLACATRDITFNGPSTRKSKNEQKAQT